MHTCPNRVRMHMGRTGEIVVDRKPMASFSVRGVSQAEDLLDKVVVMGHCTNRKQDQWTATTESPF